MSHPRPHPGVLRRNIILSLTLIIAIAIIASVLWLQAGEIGLKHASLPLQTIEVVCFSLIFLFSTVMFGSIAEHLRKEANLIVIVLAFILTLLLAWPLGVLSYERLTYGIIGGIGVMIVYLFLSAPAS
ncbi:MAG: hypothetical protein GWO20_17490 [Candidatus Korarchaeota archaeon]|nr:hypothetical protein [Candidatus Korarchaeota archaeon]NIU85052.1 hypothetical protein [Candidatus Thorarchaeota archaeon]NIW15192.1 hypothetical protein [Candidatus Thorarchaeota archaeon]NIW53104.1 hypothetical protein [Candidatus Korarchaeota archaeon]